MLRYQITIDSLLYAKSLQKQWTVWMG